MDEEFLKKVRFQCWLAYQKPEGGHCKILCDLPPPDLAEQAAFLPKKVNVIKEHEGPKEIEGEHEESQIQKSKVSTESVWPSILTVCGLVLLLYVVQLMEGKFNGSGRTMFAWVVGLFSIIGVLYMTWGRSVKETAGNFWGLTKSVLVFVFVALIVGTLAQCIGDIPENGRETGGVPDSWRGR